MAAKRLNEVCYDFFLSFIGCGRFRQNVTSFFFTVISIDTQKLGWSFRNLDPSSNDGCLRRVGIRCFALNGVAIRFLLACLDMLRLRFSIIAFAIIVRF